jgi:two-component system response regulator AtoC
VVAQTVHDLSRRRKQPFLAVNCGAISPNLIESEIFGHEKGSFTGAERQHQGFFERASGGTLFLDEITEMPLELQVKLLRVLETGRFMRVGSTLSQETDVRIIAATNRSPPTGGGQGQAARRPAVPAQRVPDRDAAAARPPVRRAAAGQPLPGPSAGRRARSAASREALALAAWPGNVRELRNAVPLAGQCARAAQRRAAGLTP